METYEQKYKEALERARLLKLANPDDEAIQTFVKDSFPELRESEDERIIRAIIDALYSHTNSINLLSSRNYQMEDIEAWLEKQKEQKPAEWSEDIIRKGIKEVGLTQYQIKWLKNNVFPPKEEQKPAEYLSKEKVFAIMNKLTSLSFCVPLGSDEEKKIHEITCDVSSLLDYPIEQKSAEWSEDDETMIEQIKFAVMQMPSDREDTKIECLTWLKSLRPQPKKELSIEKAIKWLDDTFYFLDNSSGRGRDCEITTHDFDSLEEMYDSFRKAVIVDSEPHWKPSEEQKPEVKQTRWVARDENGEIYAFEDYPEKDSEMWIGSNSMLLDRKSFPDLKWEDEPMEVEITIRKK